MTPPIDPLQLDLEPGLLWVMHCADGPLPHAAFDATVEMLGREAQPWRLRFREDFMGAQDRARRAAAEVLGARADDITLTPTTSSGLATVAQGFDWRDGDEVVAPLGEFPSNAWPWKALARRGVSFREVPLWDGHLAGSSAWDSTPPTAQAAPEDRLVAAIGPKTRIVAASWVRFQDGLKLDLARLGAACRERGVALVIDGIQGCGTAVPDLSTASALASGPHKGLLAPQGLGFLWTSAEFRASLSAPGGWLSVEDATKFDRPSTDFEREPLASGVGLEAGVPNLLGCAALAASIGVLLRAGVANIATHVAALEGEILSLLARSERWRPEAERLTALWDAGRLGSILSFHHGGRGPAGLLPILRDGVTRGIHASVREGYLRVALHGWHADGDVERLAAWIADHG